MPNTLTEWLAIWFIVAVVAAPLVGRYLANRRIRNELRALLDTSNADWAVKHREWMARRRSGEDVNLSKEALIEIAEEEIHYAMPVRVVPTEQQKELSQQNELEAEMIEYNTRPRDKALEVARIAFETGRPVIGNIDDKGKLSIDVLPERDAKWQDRARKAEGLGFIDPEDAA